MPKRLAWNPLMKTKLKDTMFLELDHTKEPEEDPNTAVDFDLLSSMFCRDEKEVKAEEEKKKQAD